MNSTQQTPIAIGGEIRVGSLVSFANFSSWEADVLLSFPIVSVLLSKALLKYICNPYPSDKFRHA